MHSFDREHTYTSQLSQRCSGDSIDLPAPSFERLCKRGTGPPAGGGQPKKRRFAYLNFVYGRSVYDADGFCPLCVAIASLRCVDEAGTILIARTAEVDSTQLDELSRSFGVQQLLASPVPLPSRCARTLAPRQRRLHGILVKLHAWSLTAYDKLLLFDADVLFVRSPARLFEMCSASLCAAEQGRQMGRVTAAATSTDERRGWLPNAGVLLVSPSQRAHSRLLALVPALGPCTHQVEQQLYDRAFALEEQAAAARPEGQAVGASRRGAIFPRGAARFSSAFNCREKEQATLERHCGLDGLSLHVMHWPGLRLRKWRTYGYRLPVAPVSNRRGTRRRGRSPVSY